MLSLPPPRGDFEARSEVVEITDRIARRSLSSRRAYLDRLDQGLAQAQREGRPRARAGCANLAHGIAACGAPEKGLLAHRDEVPNIAIVSAYNDLLSAHQPLERYPALLKMEILRAGGVAQFAGGVPAMCDGVTQGRPGMELSLFSREVVALSTAVALAHEMFDGALLLGVCDKIVPGLVAGALSFGHLPCIFVPAGPMPSGIANGAKARLRELHAERRVGDRELLVSEMSSYHAPGTCTFYGTANTNQLVMEALGLHLPGASFPPAQTTLRRALTKAAGRRIVELTATAAAPIGHVLDERAFTNAIVALLATGGSTNHTMHLVAMAAAAGIDLRWEDFADLSAIVPLLARIYPNGAADINAFQRAGGTASLFAALLQAGLMHEDVLTVAGPGLSRYCAAPTLRDRELVWEPAPPAGTVDPDVLRGPEDPFAPDGGIRVLEGTLGRGVMKVSALDDDARVVRAPARVFDDQPSLLAAFARGELDEDVVVVVRFQGPRANGMPELHRLTPPLRVLQKRGLRVGLVTDGRMSGASGSVPAVIHCTPEAADGGPLARLRDGDLIAIDADAGTLTVLDCDLGQRTPVPPPSTGEVGTGRELFGLFRAAVAGADSGASVFSAFQPTEEEIRAYAL